MSKEHIENVTKSESNFIPTFVDHYVLPAINFHGQCLINNNISIPKKIIIFYIFLHINCMVKKFRHRFDLSNCLFEFLKLTNKADLDNYKYSVYDFRFDSRSKFLFTDGSMETNVIIFRTDMSSFVHFDNEKKDTLTTIR